MEVRLHPELEAKLNRVAAQNNRRPEEYVQQLAEHYVEDQLDRGESLTHEEVGSRIEQMFRS